MGFSHDSLVQLLSENICEIVFVARSGRGSRRMLCTNSKKLLNSIAGRIALGFKPPKGVGLPYDPKEKGLVVTYDLFMQDFRQIPIESAEVISAIPLKTDEEINNFWRYFDQKLQDMSSAEKIRFMGM